MSDIIDTVQLQETGDALVDLFEITLPSGDIFRATSALITPGETPTESDNLYFPTKDGTALNEYFAIPISIEGLEVVTSGSQPRPNLSMANIPVLARAIVNNGDGIDDETLLVNILEDEGINRNVDLLGCKLSYRRTLKKYTYTVSNVAGWTTTLPTEFPSSTWILDRIGAEQNIAVVFELASPMDIETVTVPSRQVIGKYCPWKYQGLEIDGVGGCSWPVDSSGRYFDQDDSLITKTISSISTWNNSATYSVGSQVKTVESITTALGDTKDYTRIYKAIRAVPANKDPRKHPSYWYRQDSCGKLINSCKIRFQGNNSDTTLNAAAVLPFGGFPGSRKFK
jgi:lambda family phage minor tail protein L